MKEPNLNSENARLSERLREARPSPSLPPRFQEAVWRRIENTEASGWVAVNPTWLDALAALLLRPRVALAMVAVLIVAGGSLGVYRGAEIARQEAQARYVATVAPNPLR